MKNEKKGCSNKKIGQVLLEKQIINEHQLDQALLQQRSSPDKLGQILIELGYISQAQLEDALAVQEHVIIAR